MKRFIIIFFTLLYLNADARPSFTELTTAASHIPSNSIKTKEDMLKQQFFLAGLQWEGLQIYIRSFKYDGQLEVWARNTGIDSFKLIKTYKVCAMAGALGPKRMEGDYQVPEGFYYINEFNPRSAFHLSLGINYPNASDKLLSDSLKPGGAIYIHGRCVTTGCIPIQDAQIEELYLIAANARSNGQDFIPVHIFPVKFNNIESSAALDKIIQEDESLSKFSRHLKDVYEYFEKEKKLPLVSIDNKGVYTIL